jgi:hypothetical protein
MDAVDGLLVDWENEHETLTEMTRRHARAKKIPEREARFSWLHGPEEGREVGS